MTHFEAYLLTRLDPFLVLLKISTALAFVVLVMAIVCWITAADFLEEDQIKQRRQYIEKISKAILIPVLIIFSIFISLIPTSKEAGFIYIAPAIVNNQDLQETVKKLPKISNLGLEYLNNLLEKEIKK